MKASIAQTPCYRDFTWLAFGGTVDAAVSAPVQNLADALRAGDPGAFVELQRRYQPLVEAVARRYGFQSFEAADLLQEVLLSLWKARDTLPADEGALAGFMSRTAVNAAISYMRRRGVQRRYFVAGDGAQEAQMAARSASPEDELLASEEGRFELHFLQLIREFLRANPHLATYYDAVFLRGLSQEEAARELGVSRKVVRIRMEWIERALRRLRGAR